MASKQVGKKKTVSRRTSAKATQASKATTSLPVAAKKSTTRPVKPDRQKRVSGLDFAAEVLAKAGKPLNARTIAEKVIAAGWQTNGKTPHATLYSAILREITKKGKESRFRKTDRGLFEITASKGGK
jgi:HB1, ASXL, restriction endonuclease HTH domain